MMKAPDQICKGLPARCSGVSDPGGCGCSMSLFGVHGGTRIFDLGGGRYFWELGRPKGCRFPA